MSSHRKIIDGLIEQHHGRFVNSAGDSVLAEFASVVNAVQCAVEIQTKLKGENAEWLSARLTHEASRPKKNLGRRYLMPRGRGHRRTIDLGCLSHSPT